MTLKSPVEVAKEACKASKVKAAWTVPQMLVLGILAGAYIALGGWLMTAVVFDAEAYVGVGISKLIGGSVFGLGLILVIIGGAELFTGNCLMPIGAFNGCTPMRKILRAWFWVYIANYLGAALVACLIFFTGLFDGDVGVKALSIAAGKMSLPIGSAFARGILCNWLVVLAVWLSMASEDVISKIGSIYFPIMAFVASGFEHSIANMYFMTLGLLLKGNEALVASANLSEAQMAALSIGGFFHNLIPVTIGNIIGGVVFVALFYYVAYRHELKPKEKL